MDIRQDAQTAVTWGKTHAFIAGLVIGAIGLKILEWIV
jgi:hypothetical protein